MQGSNGQPEFAPYIFTIDECGWNSERGNGMNSREELKEDVYNNNLREDIKTLLAQLNTFQTKMGMYMILLGIGVSLALVVFQIFMK